jgi:hypothetical protein
MLIYANISLLYAGGLQASVPVLNGALEIAEAAGATAMVPRILAGVAFAAFVTGRAAEVASRGLDVARQAGLQSWDVATILAANAAEALLALRRTEQAAALSRGAFRVSTGRLHPTPRTDRSLRIYACRVRMGTRRRTW